MQRGTRHRVTGLLENSTRGFVLHIDDGGIWALDDDRSLGEWLGKRVTVEGIRIGYDLLAVDYVGPAQTSSGYAPGHR